MKSGLENIALLTSRLGSPQKGLRTVHVAGSNGKGSVASLLAALGTASGLKTALFTSPHLLSVRERLRIDGEPIGEAEFAAVLDDVKRAATAEPPIAATFFEVMTAAALLWFRRQRAELVVLEVGLGGRLDSTNIADSLLAVIPSISLEHCDILGDTLPQILREKVGVLRPHAICLHSLPQELWPHLQQYADEMEFLPAPLLNSDWKVDQSGTLFYITPQHEINGGTFPGAPLPLQRNRALAFKAFSLLSLCYPEWKEKIRLTPELAERAVRMHSWAARLQLLQHPQRPPLLLDGAHNPAAMALLAEAVQALYPNQQVTILIGVVSDKELEPMLEALLPVAHQFLFVRTPYPRFREPQELDELLAGRKPSSCWGGDLSAALDEAWRINRPVVACGSLYLMGALVEKLRFDYRELEWFRQFNPDPNETR